MNAAAPKLEATKKTPVTQCRFKKVCSIKKRMFDNVLDWYITLWIIPEPPVEQESQKSLFLETPCMSKVTPHGLTRKCAKAQSKTNSGSPCPPVFRWPTRQSDISAPYVKCHVCVVLGRGTSMVLRGSRCLADLNNRISKCSPISEDF